MLLFGTHRQDAEIAVNRERIVVNGIGVKRKSLHQSPREGGQGDRLPKEKVPILEAFTFEAGTTL